ncbi:Hint domain-containing protein [Tabrizicola sp.]|uniref:Hint domain-containing protein n=1 Tax=Tabrizicola sp. TaxID=2005166 RepID=UPI00286A5D5B|nr:Hint domain-containing protein [Tabrizicola sp.]
MDGQTRVVIVDAGARGQSSRGVLAGTHVQTLDGLLPVEFLEPGDRIVTRTGAVRLVAISSSVHKDATLVRICASSLGYDRPEVDLLVAPGQQIMIRDWRAKVLYGAEVAAVAASRLMDGDFVRAERLPFARLFTLRFESAQVIFAEGLELACDQAATATVR